MHRHVLILTLHVLALPALLARAQDQPKLANITTEIPAFGRLTLSSDLSVCLPDLSDWRLIDSNKKSVNLHCSADKSSGYTSCLPVEVGDCRWLDCANGRCARKNACLFMHPDPDGRGCLIRDPDVQGVEVGIRDVEAGLKAAYGVAVKMDAEDRWTRVPFGDFVDHPLDPSTPTNEKAFQSDVNQAKKDASP